VISITHELGLACVEFTSHRIEQSCWSCFDKLSYCMINSVSYILIMSLSQVPNNTAIQVSRSVGKDESASLHQDV